MIPLPLFDGGLLLAAIWLIFVVAIVIIDVAIAVWVYRDARERGMEAALWLLIVILTGLIGLIIYLIVRE